MMLYGSLADYGLGAGQPLPECPDVVGSRAAAPSDYQRPLLTPPLGVFQVLLWVHALSRDWAAGAGEMGVGAEGPRPVLLDYLQPGRQCRPSTCAL